MENDISTSKCSNRGKKKDQMKKGSDRSEVEVPEIHTCERCIEYFWVIATIINTKAQANNACGGRK